MVNFLETPLGIAVLVASQCLAVVAFVMISCFSWSMETEKSGQPCKCVAVQTWLEPWAFATVADALKYVVKEVVIPAVRIAPSLCWRL